MWAALLTKLSERGRRRGACARKELKRRGTALFAAGRLARAEAVWAQGVALFNVLMAEEAFGGGKTREDNQRQHDAQVCMRDVCCSARGGVSMNREELTNERHVRYCRCRCC